jgi:hypothetical protein
MALVLLWLWLLTSEATTLPPEQHAALMRVLDGLNASTSLFPRFAVNDTCQPTDKSGRSFLECYSDGSGLRRLVFDSSGSDLFLPNQSTLVSQVGLLSNLEELRTVRVNMQGTLPWAAIVELGELKTLAVWGNKITGTVPDAVSRLTNLQIFDVDKNLIEGTINTALCSLTGLRQLWLDELQLTGTIPECLGNLTALSILYLHGNGLTGTVPSSLTRLTALQRIGLSFNFLSGVAPVFNPVPKVECRFLASSNKTAGRDEIANRPDNASLQFDSNCFSECAVCCDGNTTRCAATSTTASVTAISSSTSTPSKPAITSIPISTTSTSTTTSSLSLLSTSLVGVTVGPTSPSDTALIAGAATGGILAVLALIGVAVCLFMRSRQSSSVSGSGSETNANAYSSEAPESHYQAIKIPDKEHDSTTGSEANAYNSGAPQSQSHYQAIKIPHKEYDSGRVEADD